MNKVVFYLMNEKGFYVLNNFLIKFGTNNIEYVVLSEDKNVERDFYKELLSLCNKHCIKFFHRQDDIPIFTGYKFAIGWRWIISDIDQLIVLHDSILPKYRGFAPLVNMLINGRNEIGVTALFASNEYDKGDIIRQEKVTITYPIKIQEAIQIISPLYSTLVNSISDMIFSSCSIIGIPQDEESASYSLWRDEQDYFINWNDSSKNIGRKIDAVGFPYNGARTYLNNKLIIIDKVEECIDVKIENRDVGKVIFVIDGYPIVVCGNGLIKIVEARFLDGESIIPFKKFRSRFGG
jgi:methionyl-tRNA formyltransferase